MTQARAVLWDLDGTLVDSEPLHHRSIIAALAAYGVTADDTVHAEMLGRSAYDSFCFCRDHLGLDADYHTFIARKYALYLEEAGALVPQPHALALYRRLRERGMLQAIVSNSDRMLVDANLRAIGLAEPDLVTVTHNDVRAGKPQPEPYLRAAWLLHADPPDCVVIEDSPTGASAGVAAGMTVVGIVGHGASASDFPSGTTTVESVDDAAALRALLDG